MNATTDVAVCQIDEPKITPGTAPRPGRPGEGARASLRMHYNHGGAMHACEVSLALPDDVSPLAHEAFRQAVEVEACAVLACLAQALRDRAQPGGL